MTISQETAGKRPAKDAKRVKFWSRISREKSQEWVLVEGIDESAVPLEAWKAFNKAFWQWKQKDLLWPLDALDAYQFAAGEMVRAADRVRDVRGASEATYLVSAAYRALMKYRERQVQPTRAEYRAAFDTARTNVVHDEEKADCEWSDKTETTCDVQAFVEALPGVHSVARAQAMRLAKTCVESTLPRLDADAQAGLRAYLAADGVWVDAAKRYNPRGSVQGYVYRFHHRWAPAFRAACVWCW